MLTKMTINVLLFSDKGENVQHLTINYDVSYWVFESRLYKIKESRFFS